MRWASTVLREIYGLFVDDGRFALAIMAWLAVAWLTLPRLHLAPVWNAAALFAGLAVIFIESATRRAGR
jgi:hypothetical protein